MLARFYLSGPFSASTLSDNFTIVGNPGNYITTGVTKTEMQYPSYKEIVFLDSVTGGTVTAVGGTCNGTSVNWSVIQSTPTPTPTPTPTQTQGDGLCYSYEVSDTVNQNDYGVRYTDPNVGTSQDVKFNMLTGIDGNSFTTFNICSTVDPTLLDYTIAPPNPTGVGSVPGVARFGGLTPCESSLDCTSSSGPEYCYVNGQSVVVGPFSTLQECQDAAGSFICDQCLGEPEP
jgi:hypothetical protein